MHTTKDARKNERKRIEAEVYTTMIAGVDACARPMVRVFHSSYVFLCLCFYQRAREKKMQKMYMYTSCKNGYLMILSTMSKAQDSWMIFAWL